jgi:Clostridial hydrophobic W
MAQTKNVPTSVPAAGQTAAPANAESNQASVQELKVTGHMMSLPSGLFCFVNEAVPGSVKQNGMPGIRVSPPPSGSQNVEIAGFRPDGWLNADGDAALVRIRKGPAQVLVTIYQLPNQQESAPRLQVRQLLNGNDAPSTGNVVPTPPPVAQDRMDVIAHIQGRGDVGTKFGDWLGERGSNSWIEGFSIAAPDGFDPASISYQAVLGRGWLSPWVEAGQYCGSRGMALPLLGLRVRLSAEAAEQYELSYAATFIGGASAGPVGNDETCEGDTLAPLEAVQITLTPRLRKTAKTKR